MIRITRNNGRLTRFIFCKRIHAEQQAEVGFSSYSAMTGYTFFIKYRFDLGIKVNSCLAGAKNKKNDNRNDRDKNKKYLFRKEIHQQLLGVKVTIIHVFQIKKSCANVSVTGFLQLRVIC